MIVASMLLILVAVLLLVLGVAGGSSLPLIGSTGASLRAGVALVIGARRAAAVRRAATARAAPAAPSATDLDDRARVVGDRATVVGEPAMAAAGPVPRGGRRQSDPSAFMDDPPPQDEGLASMAATQARAANQEDAEAALAADAAYRAEEAGDPGYGPDPARPDPATPDVSYLDASDPGPGSPDEIAAAGPDPRAAGGSDAGAGSTGDRAAPQEPGPDYDRASSVIGSARSGNPGENAWRRDHAGDAAPHAGEPLYPDGPPRPAE